jgi:hypothetical protein
MHQYVVIMSSEYSLLIKTIVGVVAGILMSNGYLAPDSKDAFVTDASTVGGIILTIVSLIYPLQHALTKAKADLTKTKSTNVTTQEATASTVNKTN